MKNFTHGMMVVDPLNPDDLGCENVTVIHFIGFWEEPKDWDILADNLREELRTDPDFIYYRNIVDRLLFYPATEDCLKHYNEMAKNEGAFDIDENISPN